jgi:hypothetical protein
MKIPVDELKIIVRHDGLVLAQYARGAVLEQLVTPSMLEGVWRVLQAEWHAESAPGGKIA